MPDAKTTAIVLAILLIAVPAAVVALIFLAKPVWKALSWLVIHIVTFIGREIADLLRILGAILTSAALVPIAGLNVALGRWDGAKHYGRAIRSEMVAACGCVYRVLIGNPVRLFMLTALTEGFEDRIPHAIAHSPATRTSAAALRSTFDGYTIVGTLPGGGSGAKLYVAEPGRKKLAGFERDGQREVAKVVIKSFSLSDGSTLPQIVRENRALPAAQRMGLILEHELTEEKFYYVTRYVPGESLVIVTQRLHAFGGGSPEGLGDKERLKEAVGYASDILRTLSRYHSGGLWHKDVKPDNIIVHDSKAELVDFGLVTPLRSSMTLTTHGTEYFRDPEMVRMALRGVKVHEVDGAKFDIYAAGAVLYSMIENSFPAHGGLSQISKRCPESLRWIVRRAMTDYDRRYENAAMMLGDIELVLTADDPFALRPADLPSVRLDAERGVEPSSRVLPIPGPDLDEVGASRVGAAIVPIEEPEFPAVAIVKGDEHPLALTRTATTSAGFGPSGELPIFRVLNWWSGRYTTEPALLGSVPGFDTAEALADERIRAKAARKGIPARLRARRRRAAASWNRAGLSTPAKIAILIAFVALVANIIWFSARSPTHTDFKQAFSGIFRETFGLSGRASETDARESLGSALILWDGTGLDSAAHTQMRQRLARLERAGFDIVGTTTASEDAKKAAHEADEIDDLRTQLEGLEFRSDNAARKVRHWLAGRGHTLVIWIHADTSNQADPWMIGEEELDQAVFKAASKAIYASEAAPG